MVKTEYEEIAKITQMLPSAYQKVLVEQLATFFGSRDPKFSEDKFFRSAALWKCEKCGVVTSRRLRAVLYHQERNHPQENGI